MCAKKNISLFIDKKLINIQQNYNRTYFYTLGKLPYLHRRNPFFFGAKIKMKVLERIRMLRLDMKIYKTVSILHHICFKFTKNLPNRDLIENILKNNLGLFIDKKLQYNMLN